MVKLGDIAEIATTDQRQAESLRAIELFPAPPDGRPRFVRVREIQDLLVLRGINMVGHRFSGSSQVEVNSPETPRRPADTKAASLSASATERSRRRLREAITRHLEQRVSASQLWQVEVEPDQAQAESIARGNRVSIDGGSPPWTGDQRFEVTVDSPDGPVRFVVTAKVTLPAAVVVTAHALPPEAVIMASDVRLATDVPADQQAGAFRSIDEVIGQQTLSSIPADKIILHDRVRPPLLIKRGNVVTVYARGAGVRVRTNARAKEDGSLGDLINVESLADRKTYLARVSGTHEVEVYARAMRAGNENRVGP